MPMFCYNNDSYVISIIHWRLKSTTGILASRIGLPCPENFGIFCHENYTFRCIQKHFLSRVSTAMLTLNIDVGILSVCLPVRPSVRHVPILYQNGLTYYRTFFSVW